MARRASHFIASVAPLREQTRFLYFLNTGFFVLLIFYNRGLVEFKGAIEPNYKGILVMVGTLLRDSFILLYT